MSSTAMRHAIKLQRKLIGCIAYRCGYVPFFYSLIKSKYMTTKEKVINESIIRVEKRLKEIKKINEATPLLDLIEIRKEVQKLLDENKTIQQRTSNEFIAKIETLSKKEKHCIKLAKENSGQKMFDLMDEQIKLEFELNDLKNEKYYIERSKVS